MKILLTSIGSRGDMEPFLAIGEMLKQKGHDVVCLFPEQFRNLALESNLRFASLGTSFIEMLESDLGKYALGGRGAKWKKIRAYIQLAKIQARNNKAMIQRQYEVVNMENPDKIIYNGKVMYPVIWEVSNGGKTIYLSPVPYLHYVRGSSHLAFNSNYGGFLNKLTYKLADWGITKAIMASMNSLNITQISKQQIKTVLRDHKIFYTISPQLFPRPSYWKSNLKIVGYHERSVAEGWSPSEELRAFLARHNRPLLFTFGSMTNPEPGRKTKIISDILEHHGIPAIINTAAGGMEEQEPYDRELICFVKDIPYNWIFPKVYAVIHHGGSGTTHLALRNGCATLIIPHIIDQFVWNKIVAKTGAGPKGLKISKLSRKKLEPLILDLIHNAAYKKNAERIGSRMRKEELREALYAEIVS